ncbi:hypothetical protein J4409_02165 [Candidatus Woesearchaeota archaeon]|nr:hypothetical protein [Candidatus Woesearchaeota archaeon]
MNEHLHIGIEHPSSHRKEMLNINVDLINVLKRIENIKRIRNKKTVQVNKLRISTKRLSTEMKELMNFMPSSQEPSFMKKETSRKDRKIIARKHNKDYANDANMDKLERELQLLKEKINNL